MNNCKTCKYFYPDEFLKRTDHGAVIEDDLSGWGKCFFAQGSFGSRVHETSKAFASDKESYAADLVVSPDFGCIQWSKPIQQEQ